MPSIPTTDQQNQFAEWLEAEMTRRGWTQAELARRADVYQSVIGGILSRQRPLSADTARRLSRALGMSQHRLFVIAGLIDDEKTVEETILVEIARIMSRMDDDSRRRFLRIGEALSEDLDDVHGRRVARRGTGRASTENQ
jgi:transcriptional regulator with XRE-family HTH domain